MGSSSRLVLGRNAVGGRMLLCRRVVGSCWLLEVCCMIYRAPSARVIKQVARTDVHSPGSHHR